MAISIAFIITLAVAAPALAFHSEEHQDATRKALIGKAHPEIVLSLINVSTIGDRGSANLNSASHYDNCAWDESRR
ncbi:MAG: hypothetical protein HC849_06015 [Oscillatoriales cyanobacterium RU_3_3]|nr:hypothetical protein [Oscillatoriales cyanobacterium RU_3_3]